MTWEPISTAPEGVVVMTKIDTSWTPVRRGKVYCSSACGHGCLYADYLKAQHAAKALAKRMGDGWKPKIWENLGWHYSAVHRASGISINEYPYSGDHFTVYALGGAYTGKTPAKAIAAAILTTQQEVLRVTETMAALETTLPRCR